MEDIINSSYEFPNEEDFSEEKDEDWWININNEIRFWKYNYTKYGISSEFMPILP